MTTNIRYEKQKLFPSEKFRSRVIGRIRFLVDRMYDQDRSMLANEILGDLDRFDLSGVSDKTLTVVCTELEEAYR